MSDITDKFLTPIPKELETILQEQLLDLFNTASFYAILKELHAKDNPVCYALGWRALLNVNGISNPRFCRDVYDLLHNWSSSIDNLIIDSWSHLSDTSRVNIAYCSKITSMPTSVVINLYYCPETGIYIKRLLLAGMVVTSDQRSEPEIINRLCTDFIDHTKREGLISEMELATRWLNGLTSN